MYINDSKCDAGSSLVAGLFFNDSRYSSTLVMLYI